MPEKKKANVLSNVLHLRDGRMCGFSDEARDFLWGFQLSLRIRTFIEKLNSNRIFQKTSCIFPLGERLQGDAFRETTVQSNSVFFG